MKVYALPLLYLLFSINVFAQNIGINNPLPAASALLDLTSTNKGLLAPRMNTAQRLAIVTPATGLLVYDITLNQFFYFDGVVWRAFATNNSAWNITGNAGTIDGLNFIGTTDNVPLNIRMNNQKAGRIDNLNTFYGLQSGNANTGINNAFFGLAAGLSNTAGNMNSFFGSQAGRLNTFGFGNAFFGKSAGEANTGNENAFFGSHTGINNTSGGNNSFFGDDAGDSNTGGSRNTAIGSLSDVISGGLINATAIGANARVDASNAMVLGSVNGINGATSTANVGIGTTNPTQRLEIAGLNVPAATSGAAQNGIARFQPTGSGFAMDVGASGAAPAHGWIQMRDNANYATNFNISLNPNGGNIGIGTINPATTLDVKGGISIQNNNNLTWGGAFGAGIPTIASSFNDGIYFYPTGSTAGIVMKVSNSLLNVTGNIRMVDGNQAAGKIMVSDAAGTGSWQTASAAANAWGLTGNAGTVDGTNFLGTTDNVPFNIKVNNLKAGRIDNINHNTMYGFVAGNSVTGSFNTMIGDSSGFSNTTGVSNTFLGYKSGKPNTTGSRNTIVGSDAARFASSNSDNTLIGYNVQAGVIQLGNNNTFIGSGALSSRVSDNNIVIGKGAGAGAFEVWSSNVLIGSPGGTGSIEAMDRNTFIGHGSRIEPCSGVLFSENTLLGFNSLIDENQCISLLNSTAIGARATVTHSNTIVLGSIAGINGATSGVNVGIGLTFPTQRLHVAGNGLFTGTVTASCGVLSCSDIRYKKNIVPLANSLTKISMLTGVSYYWRQEEFPELNFTDEKQIGVIAQELEKVFPELVHTDEKGFKTVDYAKLTPLLIEAIKEMKNSFDSKIQALEEKIDALANPGIKTEASLLINK